MLSFIKKEKTELEKLNELKFQMLENLRQAHKEWKDSEKYFESISDPDLIDYAIYEIEASKLKYVYLLKKVKEWNKEIEMNIENQSIENISANG